MERESLGNPCEQRELMMVMMIYKLVKLATVVDRKAPFSLATTPMRRRWRYFFPWITPLDCLFIPDIKLI